MFFRTFLTLCSAVTLGAAMTLSSPASPATTRAASAVDDVWNQSVGQPIALAMFDSGSGKYGDDRRDDSRKRDRKFDDDDDRKGRKNGHYSKDSGKRGKFRDDDNRKGSKNGHYSKDSGKRGRGGYDDDDDDHRKRDRDRHKHRNRDRDEDRDRESRDD